MAFLKAKIYYILGIFTALFFLFGQGVMWYAYGGDTEAYYIYFAHHIEAKPLYPLFFHVLNMIFGDSLYLYAAAVIQMVFAVLCIMTFVRFLSRHLELELFSIFCVWAASLLPFVLLLPEDPVPHVLMTESLTYPLMYLYVTVILKGIWEQKLCFLYVGGLLTVLMTLIRGQMLFLTAVTLLAFVYDMIRSHVGAGDPAGAQTVKRAEKYKRSIVFVLFLVLCIWGESLLTRGYEAFFFHAPAQDYSAQTLVQKALYCSEEKDRELFDDETDRQIFEETYAGMQEEQTTWQYAPGDLWDWKHITGSFGANSYRVGDVIEKVLTERGMWPEDQMEQESLVLVYSGHLSARLIPAHMGRFVEVSISMMPAGFVSTVLFHKESVYLLIHIATAALYLAAAGLSIAVSVRNGGIVREAEYMMFIVVTATVNVVSSNLVHFGLQRYLAYTVGMFYVGGYLLLRRCFLSRRKRKAVSQASEI